MSDITDIFLFPGTLVELHEERSPKKFRIIALDTKAGYVTADISQDKIDDNSDLKRQVLELGGAGVILYRVAKTEMGYVTIGVPVQELKREGL